MPAKRYLLYISQNYSFAILRPLQKAILARGDEVVWFLEGNEVNKEFLALDERRLTSVDEINQYNPLAIFYPANIAPTFLPGLNVAVFHGFDAGKLDKRGNNDHFKIRNCFDLYCTQGPSTTEPFLKLAENHNHFKVVETGWCALDELYHLKEEKQFTKPTVLLCSTFSKKLSCAPHLFEMIKKLSQSGKWQWIVQFHPKMPDKVVKQYKSLQGEHLSYIETDDVIPLLQQADVMVCDTSSVLIMFLLLGKPVVTYKNISPTEYLLDINNVDLLEKSIEEALSKPTKLMEDIDTFNRITHPNRDGRASDRILDAVDGMLAENSTRSTRPLDLLRQFKMRKKLNYWKFW